MSKYIANLMFLALLGCATTEAPPRQSAHAATAKKPKPMPSLDRTYDWGSRPPTAHPERNSD